MIELKDDLKTHLVKVNLVPQTYFSKNYKSFFILLR